MGCQDTEPRCSRPPPPVVGGSGQQCPAPASPRHLPHPLAPSSRPLLAPPPRRAHLLPRQALEEDGLGRAERLRVQAVGDAAAALALGVIIARISHPLQSRAGTGCRGRPSFPLGLPHLGTPSPSFRVPSSFLEYSRPGGTDGRGSQRKGRGRELVWSVSAVSHMDGRVNRGTEDARRSSRAGRRRSHGSSRLREGKCLPGSQSQPRAVAGVSPHPAKLPHLAPGPGLSRTL